MVVRTACAANCGGRSLLDCTVRDGTLVQVRPAPFPDAAYDGLCVRCLTLPQWVTSEERLRAPLRRIGPRGPAATFEEVSWDDALGDIAARLRTLADRLGPQAVGFARTSGASPVANFSRLAALMGASSLYGGVDMAVHMGLNATFGYKGAFGQHTNEWTDRVEADVVIVWGHNPAETSMTSFRHLLDARDAGTELIVIDPRHSATAVHATWWLAPRPGTDTALALGLANMLMDEGMIDLDFVHRHTIAPLLVDEATGRLVRDADGQPGAWDEATGGMVTVAPGQPEGALRGVWDLDGRSVTTVYERLTRRVSEYPPSTVEAITGIPAADVSDLARRIGTSSAVTLGFGYGVDRYEDAEMVTRAGAILALLTGNLGRPGAGVGVQSHGHGGYEARLGGGPPLPEGARAVSIPNADVGRRDLPVRALVNQGDWVNQRVADHRTLLDWMAGLDLVVTIDHFWQTSCPWSDYILPASTFLEGTTSVRDVVATRNSVLLRRPVVAPVGLSRPDADIERDLAERLGYGDHYRADPEEVADAQLAQSPDPTVAALSVETIMAAGGAVRVSGRDTPLIAYEDLTFDTPTGRAEPYREDLVPFGEELPMYREAHEASHTSERARRYPLVFTQNHVRQRAHSTFFNTRWTLAIWPEPVLEMNPEDALARGIATGDLVEAHNNRGAVVVRALLNTDYPPGLCNISEGWKADQFVRGNLQQLTNPARSGAQVAAWGHANIPFYDTRVEVRRAPEDVT